MSSLGAWPAAVEITSCRPVMSANQRANAAPGDGSEQVLDFLNDRWLFYLELPGCNYEDGAVMESFLNSFRNQINTVDVWHFARPVPRGTMRGTPTLSADVAQGAASITIQAVAGETVLDGDMLGVGGLLLQACGNATANGSGVITVNLNNRVRAAQLSGAAVTWDKPSIPCRKLSDTGVTFMRGRTSTVTVVLAEYIAP